MNKKLYISILTAAVASASSLMAQDLKKDVVIERDVEPAVRAANRLSTVSPNIYSPKVEKRKLTLSEYAGTGTLNCRLALLEPAAYADTFAVSPYRGYAALGYFPGFNLGASAGYRFLDTETTKLSAWLQYDGNSYKPERTADHVLLGGGTEGTKYSIKRHTFTIGADFDQDFEPGALGLEFAYTHDYVNYPISSYENLAQSVNKVEFGIGWKAKSRSLPWNVGVNVDYFGFGKAMPDEAVIGGYHLDAKPASETIFGLNGSIEKEFNDQRIGLDVDARFQSLNRLSYPLPVAPYDGNGNIIDGDAEIYYTDTYGSKTLGITSLKPHYIYSNGNFTADLGLKVDISTGGDKSGIYFSPDVNLAYAASSQFAIYGKIEGGKELNSLAELFEDSQFMSSAYTYERSEVPFDAKVGLNFGPFAGFTAEIWGGYSKATNWLMPASYEDMEFFVPTEIKGLRYGARLAWQYNNVFKIHAQAEGAPTGDNKGYYRWRDNARWVYDLGFTVTPIKALDVTVNWNIRTKRHLFEVEPDRISVNGALSYAYWASENENLGDANSLDISARYRINSAWSAFANIENVLSKHWLLTSTIRNQGIHGLVGVTYKF